MEAATTTAPGTGTAAAVMPGQQQPAPEKLSAAVQQQLNLESVKMRAVSLSKTIARILEDVEAFNRSNLKPKWQDVLGQFSMVNMELFSIVEEIKKVSKAFVVYPKNVNTETAQILPIMLSSKLLPEMEEEDTAKKELLLSGMLNLPVPMQIEKIKARIDLIGAACEAAEKVIADARKAYGLGTRSGPSALMTVDKEYATKIQQQENLLRAAVNHGEGLRTSDRQPPASLPSHIADVLRINDGAPNTVDIPSGLYSKNTPPFSSSSMNSQGVAMQAVGQQLAGRSVPSPSGATGTTPFENTSTPPIPYANSPRSGANIMNTPSPQQQVQQQQQQQQRQKMMQLPHHQLLAQQQSRQSPSSGVLGQTVMSQLNDIQGQGQQKFQQAPGQHQMQYSQPLLQQQFQNRQLQASHMQHNIPQSQINQGSQLRSNLNQFTGTANGALFNAAQTSPNTQMITNMSAAMQSQSMLSRMQLPSSGGLPQRNHPVQMLNDQIFSMAPNPNMVMMQQQQHGGQSGFGNLPTNAQNLQPGMVNLPNSTQNPNFAQQRQQNQQ